MGRAISVFHLKTGALRRIFSGDEEGRHLGEPQGHTALISALHFAHDAVYSGGADTSAAASQPRLSLFPQHWHVVRIGDIHRGSRERDLVER